MDWQWNYHVFLSCEYSTYLIHTLACFEDERERTLFQRFWAQKRTATIAPLQYTRTFFYHSRSICPTWNLSHTCTPHWIRGIRGLSHWELGHGGNQPCSFCLWRSSDCWDAHPIQHPGFSTRHLGTPAETIQQPWEQRGISHPHDDKLYRP